MLDQFKRLFRKAYQTLNRIDISQAALAHNYQYLSSRSPHIKIAPVLKSNAYGHGIIEVAKILDSQKAPFFCVDSLYEAYELLKANIKTPILIMGYTNPENFKVKKLPFSFAVYDLEMAKVLNSYQWDASVHIKVDTGMHRLGIPLADLPSFLDQLKTLENIKVDGLMSHLASGQDDDLSQTQIKNFQKALKIVQKYGFQPKWIHLTASEGLLNPKIRGKLAGWTNLARVGLALYGIDPSIKHSQLQPVLKLTTHIAQIKKLQKGDRVGYNGTYTASKPITLGVLPIGYFDGVDRRLSNKGIFLVDGIKCPLVGRVSMNISTINLTSVSNPRVNQEVTIFSNNPKDINSVQNSAQTCQTIAYDLLVHLASSTKRVAT